MTLFCKIQDLRNESDVEQKLLLPLLTLPPPTGMGYSPSDFLTKPNIRNVVIGKGTSSKVYFPDYVIVLSGLPVIVIEAKSPDTDLVEAIREARLYASELNALQPTGTNPCRRVVVCNGNELWTSPTDTDTPDLKLTFADFSLASSNFASLLEKLTRETVANQANEERKRLHVSAYLRPTNLIGGHTARNEEVGYNDFGARLSIECLHLFNPRTKAERAHVVRNAYVPSRRREHYADEIDRVIRTAVGPSVTGANKIADTSSPTELLRALGRGKDLNDRLFLLVGAVGVGKSTFVDYFREMKLTPELRDGTLWISINLNDAPIEKSSIEAWVVRELISQLRSSQPDMDFDGIAAMEKVFSVEINRFKKGPLSLLPAQSEPYKEMLSKEIARILSDPQLEATALARYLCAERGRTLVVVLDNCDKGSLDEQLAVFQVVKWVQSWLKCMVFLPIRDVTYRLHRDQPPLDTVIKDFVFQIEPAQFAEVLHKRIGLALDELRQSSKSAPLEYKLPNGMRVVYPASDLGYYLSCIFRSLYEHGELLRVMLVGLAGKNLRQAMEIFLDFCKSGHIRESEIFKIRMLQGKYALPRHVVARVLLRSSHRYYDEQQSRVRDLFRCVPDDPLPNHFARFAILLWLKQMYRVQGPKRVRGYHLVEMMLKELVTLGFDIARLRAEMLVLTESMCIVAEHQRTDFIDDCDLIGLTPAGFAHLKLCSSVDYLAACAEGAWISDHQLAQSIAEKIGRHGIGAHYSRQTQRANADGFTRYLSEQADITLVQGSSYTQGMLCDVKSEFLRIRERIEKLVQKELADEVWPEVDGQFLIYQIYEGVVESYNEHGVFVRLQNGPVGLIHTSKFPDAFDLASMVPGVSVKVKITRIDPAKRQISLRFARTG